MFGTSSSSWTANVFDFVVYLCTVTGAIGSDGITVLCHGLRFFGWAVHEGEKVMEVDVLFQIIEKKWHRHEAYWILKVQYCVEQKQGEELKRTLDKMKKEHIYLSSKGREDLALWIDS